MVKVLTERISDVLLDYEVEIIKIHTQYMKDGDVKKGNDLREAKRKEYSKKINDVVLL